MNLSTHQPDRGFLLKIMAFLPLGTRIPSLLRSLRTPGQHCSIMMGQRKSRGYMDIPSAGMMRNSRSHFDQPLFQPVERPGEGARNLPGAIVITEKAKIPDMMSISASKIHAVEEQIRAEIFYSSISVHNEGRPDSRVGYFIEARSADITPSHQHVSLFGILVAV